MKPGKRFISIASIFIVFIISYSSIAEHKWNLLVGQVTNPWEYKELQVGKKIVYWQQRKIGEAIVGGDQIIFKFDKDSKELLDVKMNWRDDLPPVLPELKINKELAESMVQGTVQFSNLYYISPQSYVFSAIQPTPKNPCWIVNSIDKTGNSLISVIDAVESKFLDYGISPPFHPKKSKNFSCKGKLAMV